LPFAALWGSPPISAPAIFQPFPLPFITEAHYAQWGGLERQVVFPQEQVSGGPPVMVRETDADFHGSAPLRYDFPAVTLTTLNDVVVRGRSNILTAPESIIRHGLIDLATDVTPDEFYGRLKVSEAGTRLGWMGTDRFNVDYLPEAVVFTDWTGVNYAHWLTEVLPRVTTYVQARGPGAAPLLIDADLHVNIVQSLHAVAGPDVVLHRLRSDQLVRVGVLHNISPTGYVPFKFRPQPVETLPQGVFGARALRATVDRLRHLAGPVGFDRPRVFIRRQSTGRHVPNEAEIAEVLEAKGFVTVRPESLSLPEQVSLYSRARMVVGATGAAFANLIFCQADCPIVVFMPRFRHLAYWYWRRMAAAAGAGPVIHVDGDQVNTLDDPFHPLALHQDFRMELSDVLKAVEIAEALAP